MFTGGKIKILRFFVLNRSDTGCFKKTALIEKRFKDTKYEAKFHWKSSFSSKWPLLWHRKYISIFAWAFLGRFVGGFRLFYWCFMGTSRLFQECFYVILEYVTGVPRLLQGCFCQIELPWVAVMTSVHKSKPFLTKPS